MSQASQLSPELARGLLQLARALIVAARNWALYPTDHPTLRLSVVRLCEAIRQSSLGSAFSIGITPDTLMVEGTPADPAQPGIAEAAALLHDRDLVRLTFVGDIPPEAIHAFLRLLSLDTAERRRLGGPALIWAGEGQPSLSLEQIDYDNILSREEGEVAEPARRDDLWRSIVMSIAGGQQGLFDELSQERLLAIAGSPLDIADLSIAVMGPKCTFDGSPMLTSQAATVLAAYRHLTSIVSVMAPERLGEVMGNLASATAHLDPHVVVQMLQSEEDPASRVSVVAGIAGAFDDGKVAQLLATALALDGRASDRLATIFNTIAPDEDRKRRVLTLTRSMLSETDFGKAGQFQVLWMSMEELLITYNDKPFVSDAYLAALDGAGGRAEKMSTIDLPPEISEWMESLGQANVRSLSVLMLIDLFVLERDEARAGDTAADMEGLAEDLLMSGAYDDVRMVTKTLADRARSDNGLGRGACRLALDQLGESSAMRETVSIIGDIDEAGWAAIQAIIATIGPASVEALKPLVMTEEESPASERASGEIVGFGTAAIGRIAPLAGDPRWFVQRNAARLLGRIRSPETVPLLQPMLRQADPRVMRAAVSALAGIDDPSAARAVHTILRAATGALRHAVVEALVAERDPRIVPMLIRILGESEPLGKDHDLVLETLTALGTVGSEQAIPTLAVMSQRRAFFGRRKLRALKERSVEALLRIGTPRADGAMREAAQSGRSDAPKDRGGTERGAMSR